jgi:hypothetical protein
VSFTQPGTDIKVTPESEAPIIPYETTNHGDILLPIKNDWLSALLDVIQVTVNNKMVYIRNMPSIRVGDINAKIFRYKDNKK